MIVERWTGSHQVQPRFQNAQYSFSEYSIANVLELNTFPAMRKSFFIIKWKYVCERRCLSKEKPSILYANPAKSVYLRNKIFICDLIV